MNSNEKYGHLQEKRDKNILKIMKRKSKDKSREYKIEKKKCFFFFSINEKFMFSKSLE